MMKQISPNTPELAKTTQAHSLQEHCSALQIAKLTFQVASQKAQQHRQALQQLLEEHLNSKVLLGRALTDSAARKLPHARQARNGTATQTDIAMQDAATAIAKFKVFL